MPSPIRTITVLAALTATVAPGARAQETSAEELFEKRIRPLFAEKCQVCHGGTQQMGGLDLETAEGFRKGGSHGPLVSGDAPEDSRLLAALSYEQPLKMPPTGKLSEAELAAVEHWVRAGAPWPEQARSDSGVSLWSFQPVNDPAPPDVEQTSWVRNPVDQFLLAAIERAGLEPAPEADKLTWLRRATFDLTGLPPTPEEIEAFVADSSPSAYETVVERLLASPRYGERWGRRWLDVARYADSTGADEDIRYPYAWRYRDYVIDAFNADKPYDRFVQEQIAGDLLSPVDSDAEVNVEGIVATGFLALGTKLVAEIDKPKLFYDVVDEQIDATSKAFLGLTLSCARCHDHKFDPLPTTDYYAMASIFASTKQFEDLDGAVVSKLYYRPLATDEEVERYEAAKRAIEAKKAEISEVEGEEGRRYRDLHAPRLADYMLAAYEAYEQQGEVAALAERESLAADVLERMAEYLKPGRERRPQLESWYAATDATREEVAHQYQREYFATISTREEANRVWEEQAAKAEAAGEASPEKPKFFAGDDRFFSEINGGKGPFGLPTEQRDSFYRPASKDKIEKLQAELQTLEEEAPDPPLACAVNEGEIVDQRVFVRGDVHSPGEAVPKRLPVALAGQDQPRIDSGSGRLELARWLGSTDNPLAARVMANRIWLGHFGEGLVRTPNNFGKLGEKPTHPALLDYLATYFVESGWSVKQMHRLLMLSSAYRMSSEASVQQLEEDQENRLWSRFNSRRLDVEEIRDALLTLDSSIDLTMGGAMMEGEGTDKEFSDARKSLHPDSTKRRTVYLPLRRSNLPTLFSLFDFGDAAVSNGQRAQTNVAPQALYMMNSEFVAERAGALAAKLLADGSLDDAARVREAYLTVLNRPASPERIDEALSYIAGFPKQSDDQGRLPAWTSFCRTLIASNQFLFVN